MSEFKIENDIPIPSAPKWTTKYPFERMEIGDSFFVPGNNKAYARGLTSLANRRCRPRRFTSRAVEGGVRIWRIE